MQEIRSLKPLMVTEICDPNKSRARHHRRIICGVTIFEKDIDINSHKVTLDAL